jgi:hypothetical protein
MNQRFELVARATLTVVTIVALAACSAQPPATEGPTGPGTETYSICTKYGFVPGSDGFASCSAKLSRLVQEPQDNARRCEGVRQQALRPTPSGTFSGGFGASVADADAAYQLCLGEGLPRSVQLELPSGQIVTCQQVGNNVSCY